MSDEQPNANLGIPGATADHALFVQMHAALEGMNQESAERQVAGLNRILGELVEYSRTDGRWVSPTKLAEGLRILSVQLDNAQYPEATPEPPPDSPQQS